MAEHSHFDRSLTSMDWLTAIPVNKQMKNVRLNEGLNPMTDSSNSSPSPSSSSSSTIKHPIPICVANKPSIAISAQRAEPNRPVDLYAEYKVDVNVKRDAKPPYSYVNLITFAINSTHAKRMTLNEIYQWISDSFPYYRNIGSGWKVSKTA
jgi:hypothetical protein